MDVISPGNSTKKGQYHRMQQLPYYCFDEPYLEADDGNPDKKTIGPSRRTLSRQTSQLSERQKYDPANIGIETDSREGEKERSNNLQLLCGLPKSLQLHKPQSHLGNITVLWSGTRLIDLLKNTNENAQAAVRVNK